MKIIRSTQWNNKVRIKFLLFLISTATAPLFSEVHAQQLRACSHNLGGPLKSSQENVLTSKSAFNINGYQLGIAANSLAESIQKMGNLSEICIRYQLKNLDKEYRIDRFRWPEAGMPWYDYIIPPNQPSQDWFVRLSSALPYAKEIDSSVSLPKGETAKIKALFAVDYKKVHMNEYNNKQKEQGVYFASQEKFYQFQKSLNDNNLNSDFIKSFSSRQIKITKPESLTYTFQPPGEESVVKISSSITKDGEVTVIDIDIKAGKAKVFSPLFIAFQELKSTDASKYMMNFSTKIPHLINKAKSIESGNLNYQISFNNRYPYFDGYDVFLVQHPVTISTNSGQVCLMQLSYSPIPFNIPESYCNTPQQ